VQIKAGQKNGPFFFGCQRLPTPAQDFGQCMDPFREVSRRSDYIEQSRRRHTVLIPAAPCFSFNDYDVQAAVFVDNR
jgi:hypothetical protein